MKAMGNPFAARLTAFEGKLAERGLDAALVFGQSNVKALTGVDCDNACLLVAPGRQPVFHTDFRYVSMVHRVAPYLKVSDIRKLKGDRPFRLARTKIDRLGYEASMPHARFMKLENAFSGAEFSDIEDELKALRAVKTPQEIGRIRAAVALNDRIWDAARKEFRPGMSEREMARVIRRLMVDLGDGEAFDTIVCVGANAAECHHVPDDTVWSGREPVLVDMGVKLDGYCSDMTRNLVPAHPSRLYRKVYGLVLQANLAAIAAAKPGMAASALDKVARDFLRRNGFGKAFGHSLGHGVGIDIHEAPAVGRPVPKKPSVKLLPGMTVTIEPGVYLEGNLGVRIEDLVVITESGCEVLSHSEK